mmetsp:Transcript_7164/g.19542  ORF Transcript_7164/g.19542 Transcript_7164/m.19542 type:complete len:203 (+) Transcript_7164:903-1511(+)
MLPGSDRVFQRRAACLGAVRSEQPVQYLERRLDAVQPTGQRHGGAGLSAVGGAGDVRGRFLDVRLLPQPVLRRTARLRRSQPGRCDRQAVLGGHGPCRLPLGRVLPPSVPGGRGVRPQRPVERPGLAVLPERPHLRPEGAAGQGVAGGAGLPRRGAARRLSARGLREQPGLPRGAALPGASGLLPDLRHDERGKGGLLVVRL